MGGTTSGPSQKTHTVVEVQNKDYDPSRLFKDKHEGKPLFVRRSSPCGLQDEKENDLGKGTQGQGSRCQSDLDLDQVSLSNSEQQVEV